MTARRYLPALLCAAVLGSVACGSATTTSPTTATRTSPVTESWTGIIGPGGTASRSFTTSQSGMLTATLTGSDVPLGIGIGVPRTVNGGCRLTASEVDVAGVTVSVPADSGTYCVELFDAGTVAQQASFTVQIVYP